MEDKIALRQKLIPSQKFVGRSQAAEKTRRFAEKAADSDLTILLRGETGVGKDFLAEIIHELGTSRKFVVIDCGSLTETLSEAELFGHSRGAFTDAYKEKKGMIEIAQDGTLFFNEIANMDVKLQNKFLRILDKKSFRPVGSTSEIPVVTRVIAATNANLESMVKEKTFRLDLFHRLNVLSFVISPLRERKEDIPDLVTVFANGNSERFSPQAWTVLMGYDWPGNTRELLHTIQRAIFLNPEGEIGSEQIIPYLTGLSDEKSFPSLYELERKYFRRILKACEGSLVKTAEIADITIQELRGKIKIFDLEGYTDNLQDRQDD